MTWMAKRFNEFVESYHNNGKGCPRVEDMTVFGIEPARKYPYNEPLTAFLDGFPIIHDDRFRPGGEGEEDGWTPWGELVPPCGVLLFITYDFRNYPWICTAEEAHVTDKMIERGMWWRMTGIGKEQLSKEVSK